MSVPTNQGREVHQHGSDSGDDGKLPGLSPTELEMLSTPTTEQTIVDKSKWMVPKKICCLKVWRICQNMVRTRQ